MAQCRGIFPPSVGSKDHHREPTMYATSRRNSGMCIKLSPGHTTGTHTASYRHQSTPAAYDLIPHKGTHTHARRCTAWQQHLRARSNVMPNVFFMCSRWLEWQDAVEQTRFLGKEAYNEGRGTTQCISMSPVATTAAGGLMST